LGESRNTEEESEKEGWLLAGKGLFEEEDKAGPAPALLSSATARRGPAQAGPG
jgi:hypothetical protein